MVPIGYTNSNCQFNKNFFRSTFDYVFTLGGVTISWRSLKESYIVNSIIEVEYIIASKATKEVVWLKKSPHGSEDSSFSCTAHGIVLYNGAKRQSKEPRKH